VTGGEGEVILAIKMSSVPDGPKAELIDTTEVR
jgi:hypothetical protein